MFFLRPDQLGMDPARQLWMGNLDPFTLTTDLLQDNLPGQGTDFFKTGSRTATGITFLNLDDDIRSAADQRLEDPPLIIFKVADL